MSKKAALLLGSYGQTNLGDDLLMWNYLTFLKQQGFGQIYVNASNKSNIPEIIRSEFPSLEVMPTYGTKISDWIRVIRKVGVIVYGGGTIFKELYSSTGRGKYSVIVRVALFNVLAKFLGARVYFLHIGIGVLNTWLGKLLTGIALKNASLSIFRDSESFLFASHKLGVPANKVCLATDGLFINEHWQKQWHETDISLPKGGHKRLVGVNLLSDIPDWVSRSNYVKAAKGFVDHLLKEGNHVLLIPFQHDFSESNDYLFMKREFSQQIKRNKNLVLLKSLPIEKAVSTFKELDVFVGMRFHSLLLATSTATPFMALAYDTKCWRFIEENNYQHALRLEDVSENHLTSVFNRLLQDEGRTKSLLRQITNEQLTKGQQCIKQLTF